MSKKKRPNKNTDWTDLLTEMVQYSEALRWYIKDLQSEYGTSGCTAQQLDHVDEDVKAMARLADLLHDTLVSGPARRMMSLDRENLTEKQYHIICAAIGPFCPTAQSLGLIDMSDLEVYQHCVYEDDGKVCFMDPEESPLDKAKDVGQSNSFRARMAVSPEECHVKHLRSEQRKFWKKFRPDVFARFRGSGRDAESANTAGNSSSVSAP